MTLLHLLLAAGLAAELGPPPTEAPALPAVLAEAREHGVAARQARQARDAVVETLGLTRPVFRPDTEFAVTGQVRGPEVREDSPDRSLFRPYLGLRAELTARQIVYHAGLAPLVHRRAAQAEAAELELAIALAAVDHAVARAWYQLLSARAGFAIADEAVRRAESQLTRVEDLLQVEKVAEVDRLHAQAGIYAARAARVEAAEQVELAAANLNRLLGRDDLGRAIAPAALADLPPALPAVEVVVDWAREHRPEVALLAARRREAEAGGDLARSQRAPTVAIVGALAAQTADALNANGDATLGFELRLPLSRTEDQASRDVAAARQAVDQLGLAAAELRAGLAMQVRTAWLAERTARAKLELATANVGSATEAHRVTLLQYDRQRATMLEVNEALAARSRGEQEQAIARYAIWLAVADLEWATARPITDWTAPQETSHAED